MGGSAENQFRLNRQVAENVYEAVKYSFLNKDIHDSLLLYTVVALPLLWSNQLARRHSVGGGEYSLLGYASELIYCHVLSLG